MFISMNLVAQKGHGYTRPVGARGRNNVARVGAVVAENNYARHNAKVYNDGQYSDATDKAEGAPAIKVAQCQVCILKLIETIFNVIL